MKTKLSTVIAMAMMAAPAMAQNLENHVFANQNVKAVELSQTEMQETQGEWGPVGALAGGFASGAGYLIEQQISGNEFSPTALATYVGKGAVLGGGSGPMGVIWGFNSAIAEGTIRGTAARYGW